MNLRRVTVMYSPKTRLYPVHIHVHTELLAHEVLLRSSCSDVLAAPHPVDHMCLLSAAELTLGVHWG